MGKRRAWYILFAITLLISVIAAPVQAASTPPVEKGVPAKNDNKPDPLTDAKLALRQKGLEAKLNGKAKDKTYQAAKGQFAELEREGTGMIWTVLGEFSDLPHNSITKPDRSVNNTTIWDVFNHDYYMNMLFGDKPGANSMRNYYLEQSSGRYTVAGDVTDWVTVGNHLKYDDNPDSNVWYFIQDTVNAWYAQQIAAGKTKEQINAYLSEFDKYDRYNYDGDNDFNEPDGYIDTFQSVHSGEGEEAGGGTLGAEAIWSHSWYAFSNLIGKAGPAFNKMGGIQIGDSNYWIGKYTIQPENGGVGVFTHEYGHDLGLPDLYDTSGGENGTGFWTLMSSGSWMGDGTVDIGSKSSHMGAWEKFQLGWLNYEVGSAAKYGDFMLGPMEHNTAHAQALFVVLPQKLVTTNIGAPYAGSYYYYSGAGDNLDSFMFKSFSLPAGATLSAKVKYDTELEYDYAYLVYSTDGGTTWKSLQTNLSTTADPNGQNFGFGINGSSGGKWVDLTANLPAGNVLLGFRYWTDTNTGGFGFMADDISITGQALDGAETAAGWTYTQKPNTVGFHVTNGTEQKLYNHYYIAEYRTYRGYDSTLKVGPYFFGYMNNPALVNYVDHFPYQDGLLINYWDTSQKNNNTIQHPGAGLILPIDAHYTALTYTAAGVTKVWRNRIQTYDSTFTLDRTDALNLHVNSVLQPIASQKAVSVFDDTNRDHYYDSANPQGSVIAPNTNTQIRIMNISAKDNFMLVQVAPAGKK